MTVEIEQWWTPIILAIAFALFCAGVSVLRVRYRMRELQASLDLSHRRILNLRDAYDRQAKLTREALDLVAEQARRDTSQPIKIACPKCDRSYEPEDTRDVFFQTPHGWRCACCYSDGQPKN